MPAAYAGKEIMEIYNFDGMITSPALFRRYCIPFMQRMADLVHARGRLLASHMDGDMKPLLDLIPQTGLDVVESFSPAPGAPGRTSF